MLCPICKCDRITMAPLGLVGYFLCRNCQVVWAGHKRKEIMTAHVHEYYGQMDPHQQVADSKKAFFVHALGCLEKQKPLSKPRLLDVGCGYGYFLQMAQKQGWQPTGVEVVEKAAQAARQKIPETDVHTGTMDNAPFSENTFDAVTSWDVLGMCDNPADELAAYFRVLKPGGILGIRERNASVQKMLAALFLAIKPFNRFLMVKNPSVFHPFCFSAKSFQVALTHAGFTNIRVKNSPTTKGDAYRLTSRKAVTAVAKSLAESMADAAYVLSAKNAVCAPSLLVWAKKPK